MKSGIKIVTDENKEKSLDMFLDGITMDLEQAEDNYLKRGSKLVKTNIVKNLNILKTRYQGNKQDYKHMADDVSISIRKNKYGERVARVSGGKKTGAKWHVVNDGTYRNKATHFIDSAMHMSESELKNILDEELRRV